MTTKLLVNVETPHTRPELQHEIKRLAVDCLELMQRNSQFEVRVDVVDLPPGTALTAPSEIVVQLISGKPLLTKSDVAQRNNCSPRTVERDVKAGKLPRPKYIHGPRWRPEDIVAFERQAKHYPCRD